jgi:hypothetical protein
LVRSPTLAKEESHNLKKIKFLVLFLLSKNTEELYRANFSESTRNLRERRKKIKKEKIKELKHHAM